MVTSNIVEAWVSIKRLSKFFASDELQPDARTVAIASALKQGDTARTGRLTSREILMFTPGTGDQRRRIRLGKRRQVAGLGKYRDTGKKGRTRWCVWESWRRKGTQSLPVFLPLIIESAQTSLLSAIIGDMRRTDGQVKVYGTVAFACQNPWCANPISMFPWLPFSERNMQDHERDRQR